MVKIGIIGLGNIAARFAENVNKCELTHLEAVASRDLEKANLFKEKHNATKAYGSYLELVNDKSIDIIYISLPHNLHYDATKLCLMGGKAVICEKPFLLTEKETIELTELAKSKNLLLVEAMWTRMQPNFAKMKNWIGDGKIGEVKMLDATFGFHAPFNLSNRLYDKNLAGGALYDAGIYPLDFVTGIMDEEPIEITGKALIGKQSQVDEYNSFTMKFKNGAIAHCKSSISVKIINKCYVYGEKGYIIADSVLDVKNIELFDNNDNLLESFQDQRNDGFFYEVQHMANLFNQKKLQSDLIPHQHSIISAKVFETLMKDWKK